MLFRSNSYVLKLQEEDLDGGQPVSYELPVEYINHCWYGLNWNEALKQYFTNPKELLPEGYRGLHRGEPSADEPGPSTIPPPIQPLGEPLQAGTTFTEGIHSLLQGTTTNLLRYRAWTAAMFSFFPSCITPSSPRRLPSPCMTPVDDL